MQLYECARQLTNHPVDLSKAMVINTHSHTQTHCMLESWHIQSQQAPLNRDRGTLPGLCCNTGLTLQPSGILLSLCYYPINPFSLVTRLYQKVW